MRFPAFVIIIIFFLPDGISALDETSWAGFTGRDENLLVIPYMTADFDTAVRIIRNLSVREDPFIGDILDYFNTHVSPGSRAPRQAEIHTRIAVLTNLLSSFFSSEFEADKLQARIEANRKELAEILRSLPFMRDTDLKIEAARLIALFDDKNLYPLIVAEIERLADKMTAQAGLLSQPEEKLAFRLITVVRDCEIREARPALQAIVHRSRTEILVKTSRTVLAGLSPSP